MPGESTAHFDVRPIVWTILLSFVLIDISGILMAKFTHVEVPSVTNSTQLNSSSEDIPIGETGYPRQQVHGEGIENPENIADAGYTPRTAMGSTMVKEVSVQYDAVNSRTFQQLQTNLTAIYPHIVVSGSEYPLKPMNAILGKVLSYGQYGVMILMFAGDFIFAQLKMAPPAIFNKMKEKRMMVIMVVMLLGNTLHGAVTSSGAYEVFFDGNLAFSKLATHRMPTFDEIEGLLTQGSMTSA